jgi:hypothetical protein
MIKIKDFTGKTIAEIKKSQFNQWCNVNGFLPHHKSGNTWFVIAK